jgi:acetyl-CoA synthetase
MSATSSNLTFEFPAEIGDVSDKVMDYETLHKYSIENRELFWGTLAKNRLDWYSEFDQISSGSFQDPDANIKWFINGKLNVSVNCVDRHYLKNPNKVALIWEKDEPGCEEYVTYEYGLLIC